MNRPKAVSLPRHRRHEAWQHNTASRLEGVVKNKGIKPTRKHKKTLRQIGEG
jgi:hypothetical protein